MKCITNIGLLATAKGTSPRAGSKQGEINLKKIRVYLYRAIQ